VKSFAYINDFFCDKIIKYSYYFALLERRNKMSRYRMPDFSNFPDCCALSERGSCTWLTEPICRGEECTIKRTTKENSDSLQHVYQRLSSLDTSMQIQIGKKYYHGSMPWNETKAPKACRLHRRFIALNNKTVG
jgi:hypothetical protein